MNLIKKNIILIYKYISKNVKKFIKYKILTTNNVKYKIKNMKNNQKNNYLQIKNILTRRNIIVSTGC